MADLVAHCDLPQSNRPKIWKGKHQVFLGIGNMCRAVRIASSISTLRYPTILPSIYYLKIDHLSISSIYELT